jgi:hypothetical protein
MSENPENPENPPRKRGRPRKLVVDPSKIDPLAVLRQVASDPKAPASARVAACKLLLEQQPASALDFDLPRMDAEVERVARERGFDRLGILRPPKT